MIALSYRRNDSKAVTGRLYDCLRTKFGRGNVFMDLDSIPYGTDFHKHIQLVISRSKALVVIIGPNWRGRSPDGTQRLDDPSDVVRLEVAFALQNGIPVFPVLVDDATMPPPEELPSELKELPQRNAIRLDTGVDFDHHANRLVTALRRVESRRRFITSTCFLGVGCCVLVVLGYLTFHATQNARRDSPPDTVGKQVNDPTLKQFIEDYVRSGNYDTPEVEVAFFADQVIDYFGKRDATRDYILADRRAHIAKWPQRRYKLLSEPELLGNEAEGILVVLVRIDFDLRSAERHRSGTSTSIYRIQPFASTFKIVSAMEGLSE